MLVRAAEFPKHETSLGEMSYEILQIGVCVELFLVNGLAPYKAARRCCV